MNRILPVILSMVTLVPMGTPAMAQSYLQKAVSAKTSGPVYSYDLQYISPEFRARARIHPNRAKGKRVTIISPPKSQWGKDEKRALAEVDRKAPKAAWCHNFAKRIPIRRAKLVSQTGKTATYSFKPVPDPKDPDDAKVMKNLVGMVTVDKARPAILKFSLRAPKSFKPAFVARINKFTFDASCARSPDGRTYVRRFDQHISGSAMMRKFVEKETRIHTALKRVGG